MKFVDVKNDVAFRKIFGNENRTQVLISFLNAVLYLENDNKIVEVTILTPYQLPELRGGKVTIVDVKAKEKSGKTYIVEMQVAEIDGFHKRVLYYASKSYSSQISRGDQYKKLMPTLFIGILDFVATKSKNYISRHIVKDAETDEHFIKDIEFTFIELPKFKKHPDALDSVIDQWVYFIKNAEDLNVIPVAVKDEGLKFAYEDADKHNWKPEELEAYDKIFMREEDDRGRFDFALRKAVKIAVEAAVETAVINTTSERDRIFAKKMIQRGRPNNEISEDTGLTPQEIEELRNEK